MGYITMTKIDEVSRALGRLEGGMKELRGDSKQIMAHLEKQNGTIAKTKDKATKNETDIKWITRKSLGLGLSGGGVITFIIFVINWLRGVGG